MFKYVGDVFLQTIIDNSSRTHVEIFKVFIKTN